MAALVGKLDFDQSVTEQVNKDKKLEKRVHMQAIIRDDASAVSAEEPSTASTEEPSTASTEEPFTVSAEESSTTNSVKFEERQRGGGVSESKRAKKLFLAIKALFGVIFCAIVLICAVFSKLTLVYLTEKLNVIVHQDEIKAHKTETVAIYWQLLLVIMIPTFLTFLRTLAFGVLGKTTKSYPWPTMRSTFTGIGASIFEVLAICVFVFLVLTGLPPGVSIFLLSGVVFCQLAVDFWYTKNKCCHFSEPTERDGYRRLEESQVVGSVRTRKVQKILTVLRLVLENKIMKLLAIFFQLVAIIVFIILWSYSETGPSEVMRDHKLEPMIGLPLSLFALSLIWTNKFQDYIVKINTYQVNDRRTARYKSSFINSLVRLFLYPFVSYIIFRYAFAKNKIDPWCLEEHEPCLDFSGNTLSVFLVQIFTTLFAYLFAWMACKMTLSPYGMALPLLITTPLSAICYYVIAFGEIPDTTFFPQFSKPDNMFGPGVYPYAPLVVCVIWVGQLLGIGFYVLTRRNIILARDQDMFLTPYYDGIFFEQQMILNRQTRKFCSTSQQTGHQVNYMAGEAIKRNPRTVFICSTMYRENAVEMHQMLTSINRVALNYEREKKLRHEKCDQYESHIFFDGALNGTQIGEFGLQLLSLLKETLGVKPRSCAKKITPYGMCLEYKLNEIHFMPFHIHFKDRNLVKPKKRWSQVMYMNYVINHRIKMNPKLTAENTFILTTDADIDFTAKSAVVLLDILETNPLVGAVCARTHPKGSGPLYWYQVFDYAIGHWFQKPAEHLMGCVLCSPGCFSVFRCSALQEVLETYSSLATDGMEFLMKDMGEDRWLCTLLIKQGWRLEYCAISEDLTYCPLEFGEFFGQRRRWIPSTIANLSVLISETSVITRKNDTVSILFIIFQAIMVFSTFISPATVILVIASGLQSSFKLSDEVVLLIISLLILVSVFYGAVCLFASPKTQIDMAKLLSFIFAIVMIIVFLGIFKDVILDIFPDQSLVFLQPPNCTKFITGPNATHVQIQSFEDCIKTARYLASLPNTVDQNPPFKLPVSTSVIYLGVFAFTFVTAAILHFREFTCLFHFIWYILALPSGYLLLLIYSAVNLDSQSWGTREGSSGADEGLLGWWRQFKEAMKKLIRCCSRSRCCVSEKDHAAQKNIEINTGKKSDEEETLKDHTETPLSADIKYKTIDEETRAWLENQGCSEAYIQGFVKNGYTSKHYIAAMTLKDFEAIGIDKRGLRLRLAKAAKRLPSLPIHVDVPDNVEEWLKNLEMSEYTKLFKAEGYENAEDIENLKGLTEKDLKGIGITKRAHLQRFMKALHNLVYPKEVEQRMYHTKGEIENVEELQLNEDEFQFWKTLIAKKLKPLSTRLTSTEEVRQSLRSLRNTILVVLFLINIMWIIALYSVEFPRLTDYGLDPRAFQLLFLFVYGFIIIVQFVMMLFHRVITLVHYFGRITPIQVVEPDFSDEFDVVSIMPFRPNTHS